MTCSALPARGGCLGLSTVLWPQGSLEICGLAAWQRGLPAAGVCFSLAQASRGRAVSPMQSLSSVYCPSWSGGAHHSGHFAAAGRRADPFPKGAAEQEGDTLEWAFYIIANGS